MFVGSTNTFPKQAPRRYMEFIMSQNIQQLIGSYEPQVHVSVDRNNTETDGSYDLVRIEILPVDLSVDLVESVVKSVQLSEYFSDLISVDVEVAKFNISVDIYCEYFTVSEVEVKELIIGIVHELHNQ